EPARPLLARPGRAAAARPAEPHGWARPGHGPARPGRPRGVWPRHLGRRGRGAARVSARGAPPGRGTANADREWAGLPPIRAVPGRGDDVVRGAIARFAN